MADFASWSTRAPSNLVRLILFALLSVGLMMLDHRGQHLDKIRSGLNVALYPLQAVASVPTRTGAWLIEFFRGDQALREEHGMLRAEYPLLLAKLQKYEAIETENAHLRKLLSAAARVAERALAAELLEVGPEPFTRKLVIAKGGRHDVFLGQPVIDAFGIMGQITEVNLHTSRVTLITDPSHAIPVQVNRSGLRAMVFGTGQDTVAVRYLTALADIQEGDLLVSSGIGGGFPAGYPVARVSRIGSDPNEAFLKVEAKPVAQLGHNKEALLIWPGDAARGQAKK
jgi:rod shape-determining protein MreC